MKVLNASGQYIRSDSYQNQGYVNVGKMAPDFLASFRNNFRYKNISLNVLIDARVGGNVISATYNYASQLGVLQNTLKGRTRKQEESPIQTDKAINRLVLFRKVFLLREQL